MFSILFSYLLEQVSSRVLADNLTTIV